MRLPSTNVTVPVAATLKSPLRRTALMASPGWKSVVEAAEVELVVLDPLGTATKPIASRYFENREIVSGAKLESERGTAIGLTPAELAGVAFANPFSSFSKSSVVF